MGGFCRVLAAVMLVGCASSTGGSSSLVKMLEREAPAHATTAIEHPTGLFRARVPGRLLTPLEDSENSAFGQFDIGAGTPASCHFFFDRVDLASTLVRSSDVIIGQIAADAGVEVQRAVERIDAGAIAGSPFLSLDWLFWMDAGGGEIKQRAANRSGRSVYCAHDSPGYVKSFERFFAALVETLEYPGASTPETFYREVAVTSIGEQRVGVIEIGFVRDAAGEVRTEKFSAALTASGGTKVGANDVYQVEWSRANGELVSAHYAAMDGDVVTELRLMPARDDAWSVVGRFRSRPLETRFEVTGPLASSLSEYRVYRDIAAGGEAAFLERWVPESDPTRATPFGFTSAEAEGAAGIPVRVQMGSRRIDLLLDRVGRLLSAKTRIGQAELSAELVHSEGGI
jgi:hypothetical protein